MKLLKDYAYFFLHPKNVFINNLISLNSIDSILVSWPLTILDGFKNILLFWLLTSFYQSFILSEMPFMELLVGDGKNIFILYSGLQLLKIMVYPLMVYLRFWVWGGFIDLFITFGKPINKNKSLTLIGTLCSHFFLLIPFIGHFLQKISSFTYFYWGLIYNMGFRPRTAFLITLMPISIYGGSYLIILRVLSN